VINKLGLTRNESPTLCTTKTLPTPNLLAIFADQFCRGIEGLVLSVVMDSLNCSKANIFRIDLALVDEFTEFGIIRFTSMMV